MPTYAPRDVMNKVIKVGSLVVYPVRRRSRLTLEKAVVTIIDATEIIGVKENGRSVKLIHPERIIVHGR
jgi:hypothetical protein